MKPKPETKTKKTRPAHRPPMQIDTKLLEALAERALTQADCAAVLGISVDTIQRRYLAVYEAGLQKAKASLRRSSSKWPGAAT